MPQYSQTNGINGFQKTQKSTKPKSVGSKDEIPVSEFAFEFLNVFLVDHDQAG